LLAHTDFVFADRVQDDDEAEETAANDDDNEVDDEDDDDDDNEADDEDDDDNEEDANNIMAPTPKLKSPPKPKSPAKAHRKQDDAEVGTLVSSVKKKLKIAGPMPYSVTTGDGYIVKYYTHKFKDYVEVEFFVNGVLPQHGYKAELSEDGMSLKWRKGIPDYFFESKRMLIMLGNQYHHNDTCVIAHDNVVQQIRRGGTENQGLHFASEEQAQIVPLEVRCTGNPRVKETLQKCDKVVVGGNTHYQFNSIYSCKLQAMEQRSAQKKKAVRSVFLDEVGDLSDDDDSDADDPMNVTRVNPVGSMSP
jgi:hypothetical protein